MMKPPERGDEEISPEQYIADHTFLFLLKGVVKCYDGTSTYIFKSGELGFARKNRLARYKMEREDDKLEKIFIFLDEKFLRMFREKHKIDTNEFVESDTFIKIETNDLILNFIQSLMPYYKGGGKIDPYFEDIKREEFLIIMLQAQPALAAILFDFGIPAKINLEEFMNLNYKFNVSIERFAWLTGRSLSAFKRDFKSIFNKHPAGGWYKNDCRRPIF